MHEPGLKVCRSFVMHPTYRGNGYAHPCSALGMGLCREWNITKIRAWTEVTPTFPAITPMRARWATAGFSLDFPTDINTADYGNLTSIKKLEANETQYEALKTNCPGWVDVTYTVSTS